MEQIGHSIRIGPSRQSGQSEFNFLPHIPLHTFDLLTGSDQSGLASKESRSATDVIGTKGLLIERENEFLELGEISNCDFAVCRFDGTIFPEFPKCSLHGWDRHPQG